MLTRIQPCLEVILSSDEDLNHEVQDKQASLASLWSLNSSRP